MKGINIIKKISVLIAFALCLTGCGNGGSGNAESTNGSVNKEASLSEDNFEWDGNIIVALTDKGAKQKSIVIPARCEGFNGTIFANIENNIKAVSFESDNDIALNGVFSSAENLTTIELPAGLTTIDNMEFWLCSSLEKITIPANVSSIGSYAFQNNKSLTEVAFEGDVTIIMPHAFEGCVALKTIVLPDTITLIDEYAFYGCTALETITLPASLSEVGAFAFANNGLTTISVPYDMTLSAYTTTSFVQADHDVIINVKTGSWMEQNFESVFNGAFIKNSSN